MMYFNLQLFGGKGGGGVAMRDPTENEERITKNQADIVEHYAPNAIALNDIAMDLLKDSYGAVQVDFSQLSDDAQNRINNALNGLSNLPGQNNAIVADTDNNLRTAYDNYGLASMWNYDRYNNLGDRYDNATQDANRVLGNYINGVGNAANRTNNALGGYSGVADRAARATNNALDNYKNSTDETTNKTNADLSEYINQNNRALGTVDGLLAGLQNGVLPSAYTQNMEDTIRGVLQKTMGENLNNMAQRGVINSSVNEAAQNAIAENAANAVAQNFINNLNTVGQFGQQRFLDNNATTNANAQMSQNQLDNVIKNADKGASLTQQQLNNIMSAIGTETGLIQQQYGNTRDAINTGSTLTQQQLGNTSGMLGNLGQMYGQQYNEYTGAIGQQAGLSQQRGQNALNANSQNAGIYGNITGQASTPITTAAGAQEAAQGVATNLWNTSMGLTNTGNNTLSAIASANSSRMMPYQNGGGNFWGGLLGGVGTYLGAAACFPKGTMIHLADGGIKDIADIDVGDEVIDKDGKTAKVILLLPKRDNDVWELTTKDGAKTRTTATQPFFLEDGSQKELRYLTPDDILLNMGEIESIRRVGYMRVYDFETDGDNNYIVDSGFIAQGGGVEWWKEDKE